MPETLSLEEALQKLGELAPDAPLLALGQTIFWDEPMKGGVLLAARRLGYERRLYAGVHDTDYFAKMPTGPRMPGKFRALPHNDTTTKGLWSAAAEFSTLFGSETVITRELLQQAGLKVGRIVRDRPGVLDEATEAWGWKGIVSLDDQPPVAAEVPLSSLFRELYTTLEWAIESTLLCLSGEEREAAQGLADGLKDILCGSADEPDVRTLGDLYADMIGKVYDFCANRHVDAIPTRTTELLRFNTQTAGLPRFQLLDVFLRSGEARVAYDEAIAGSEIYPLARFGTGAIPFDLYVPGLGRGTIRIGSKAVVVMTPKPIFIPLRNPVTGSQDLAAAIEARLGPGCTLVGKAVTLIGMLAAEFVFIFHEGASPYVRYSRKLHELLVPHAPGLSLNPVLRIGYSPWDELDSCCSWLKLPPPLREAFGADELCAPSFAMRWREVVAEQEARLAKLGALRRPVELIRFLGETEGASWNAIATEYERLHGELERLRDAIEEVRSRRRACFVKLREQRRARVAAEAAKGRHFRDRILEKQPSEEDLERRARLAAEVEAASAALHATRQSIRELRREQALLARKEEVLKLHERRDAIEIEAELTRLSLIRNAVIAGRGLVRANNRPSAWWFPMLCPDGLWFRATVDSARCRLEPLV